MWIFLFFASSCVFTAPLLRYSPFLPHHSKGSLFVAKNKLLSKEELNTTTVNVTSVYICNFKFTMISNLEGDAELANIQKFY